MMPQDLDIIDEGQSGKRSEFQLDLDPVNVVPAGHDTEDWGAELKEVVESPLGAQDKGVIDEGLMSDV